jgi:ribose transport system permease protein
LPASDELQTVAAAQAEPRRADMVRPRAFGRAGGEAPWFQRYSLVFVLALVVIVFSILSPDTFPTKDNITSVLLQQIVPACIALAVLMPIIVGEFDLSAGYTLGFTAVIAAKWGHSLGVGGGGAIGLALVFGALVGLVNGLLVAVLRFGSLIATLGVGLTVSGLSVGISDSQTISTGIPELIGKVTTTSILGLASGVWITLVLAIVLYLLVAHTPVGRRMFATGANERVSLLAGVRTKRLKIIAFVLAGLLAAVAGLFQVGLSGAANPGYGANLLLPAFAAVFLGSTAIRPGTFNVWGTVLAILILAAGFSGLSLQGVPFWVEPVFDGLVLIVAVFFSRGRGRSGAF